METLAPKPFCNRCCYYKKHGKQYFCKRRKIKDVLCGQIQHYVKTANGKVELIKDIY